MFAALDALGSASHWDVCVEQSGLAAVPGLSPGCAVFAGNSLLEMFHASSLLLEGSLSLSSWFTKVFSHNIFH